MEVFRIDCDGVIYHVTGKTKEEALQHLVDRQMEWNNELDSPFEKWLIEEVKEPFEVRYNENDDEGDPLIIMSDELITDRPDILCCSEW